MVIYQPRWEYFNVFAVGTCVPVNFCCAYTYVRTDVNLNVNLDVNLDVNLKDTE